MSPNTEAGSQDTSTPMAVEYVLPLKWSAEQSARDAGALRTYLRWLAQRCSVTVVDGSERDVYERHARLWGALVRHVPPAPWPALNGKVTGVVTGVRGARHEHVVSADDDVRHTDGTLAAVVAGLELADLVRPQNVFTELPWHARWDTGRTLLNRCFGVDHPGTFALRRTTFLAMGGYDGDVMFENLELARTVTAHGGRVLDLPHVFVPRLPPTARHFWSQRVRQAYDSLAQPPRLAVEMVIAPLTVLLAVRAPRLLPGLGTLVVAAAEVGRRRSGGTAAYPPSSALWSLPWVLERGVCSWLALLARARGGVSYGGHRIRRAAASQKELEDLLTLRAGLGPVEPLSTQTSTDLEASYAEEREAPGGPGAPIRMAGPTRAGESSGTESEPPLRLVRSTARSGPGHRGRWWKARAQTACRSAVAHWWATP